ncbi:MAG: putative rhamnosyl transferase [Rickettsiales bacterium]|jgi:hypothetical protein|nr:putative rhamnosyl transferase [Rickettsiales bacterium]
MIIGMVRYSVLNAFLKGHPVTGNVDLWKNPYLQDRLKLFRAVTLASLLQQTNKDFILLLYHSDTMPEDARLIFKGLETEFPFLRNVFISDDKMTVPDDIKAKRMLTFRIDNDDGLPKNFMENMQNIYLRKDGYFDNTIISIPNIRKIQRVSENTYKTGTHEHKLNSIGLAYLSTDGKTIRDIPGAHNKDFFYEQKSICLRGVGGLQCIHGYNVANGFYPKHDGMDDVKLFAGNEITDLLKSEGYPNIDLPGIPISNRDEYPLGFK